jgi:hypothetical protein
MIDMTERDASWARSMSAQDAQGQSSFALRFDAEQLHGFKSVVQSQVPHFCVFITKAARFLCLDLN